MMRSKIMFLIAMAAAATIVGGSALAQPGGGMRADSPHGEIGWRLERLDLTDDQKAEIAKLRAESRESRPEAEKQLRRLQHELHGEMLQDEPDTEKMRDLVRKIGELRTERQLAHLNLRLAIRERLTPEQRDQMLLQGGCWGGGRGPSGGPGFGDCHGCGHGGPGRCGPRRAMGHGAGHGPGSGMQAPGHPGPGMHGPGHRSGAGAHGKPGWAHGSK